MHIDSSTWLSKCLSHVMGAFVIIEFARYSTYKEAKLGGLTCELSPTLVHQ